MWILFAGLAVAALPPDAAARKERAHLETAAEARAAAPAVVEIEVLSIDATAKPSGSCFEQVESAVTARVTAVTRADPPLRPGSTLTIHTSRRRYRADTGCVGPAIYADVVKQGATYLAHLRCTDPGSCHPVASYGAFWTDTELQAAFAETSDILGLPPPHPPSPVDCSDPKAFEDKAVMGALSQRETGCLHNQVLHSTDLPLRVASSRVLLSQAVAAGEFSDWRKHARYHLEMLVPDDLEVLTSLAVVEYRSGQLRRSMEAATRALAHPEVGADPKRPPMLHRVRTRAALDTWRRLRDEADPSSPTAHAEKMQQSEALARTYAVEWLRYLRGRGLPTEQARKACLEVATEAACSEPDADGSAGE